MGTHNGGGLDDRDIPMQPVTVEIPVGGEITVLLIQVGPDMCCQAFGPTAETLRHLKAAYDALLLQVAAERGGADHAHTN